MAVKLREHGWIIKVQKSFSYPISAG